MNRELVSPVSLVTVCTLTSFSVLQSAISYRRAANFYCVGMTRHNETAQIVHHNAVRRHCTGVFCFPDIVGFTLRV